MADDSNALVQLVLSKGGLSKDVTDKTFETLGKLKKVLHQLEGELKRAFAHVYVFVRVHDLVNNTSKIKEIEFYTHRSHITVCTVAEH